MKVENSQNKKLNQGGFTLIELLITITVIAVLAGVILPIGQSLFGGSRADAQLTSMNTTMKNIQERYRKEPISSTLDNARLISSELIAKSLRFDEATSTIWSAFDNSLVTVDGLDGNGLQWVDSAVPIESCIDFVFGAEDYGWDNFSVDGTQVEYLNVTQDDYDTACSEYVEFVEVTFRIEPAA